MASPSPLGTRYSNVEARQSPSKRARVLQERNHGGGGGGGGDDDDDDAHAAVRRTLLQASIEFDERGFACRQPSVSRMFLLTTLRDNPRQADDLMEGLAGMLEDAGALTRALAPLRASLCGAELAAPDHGSDQTPSIVRLLLGIDAVQERVASLVVQQLAMAAEGMGGGGGGGGGGGAADSGEAAARRVRSLLHQLRWLDYLVNGEQLTEELMQVLEIVPPAAQRELISVLPEIVGDAAPEQVCGTLKALLLSQLDLMVPILDALTSLNLPAELVKSVTDDVLKTLSSAAPDDLPVVVRYLLHTAEGEQLELVVDALRSHLRFERERPAAGGAAAGGGGGGGAGSSASAGTTEQLTLEALRAGMHFKKINAGTFLQRIAACTSVQAHTPADIWILTAMFGLSHFSTKAVTMFKRKVAARQFTRDLLAEAISGHASALHSFFPTLLALAECFVRPTGLKLCGVSKIQKFGAQLYELMFAEFVEPYHRQEVVGNLITHAGSGNTAEVDAALGVLVALVDHGGAHGCSYARALHPFSSFVKALLDFVDNLNSPQLRRLFKVLCQISQAQRDDAAAADVAAEHDAVTLGLYDHELHIVIRKMLTHSTEAHRRVGIIGAVAAVQCLCRQHTQQLREQEEGSETAIEQQPGSPSGPAPPLVQAVISTLRLLHRSCKHHAGCQAFMLDELDLAVRSGEMLRQGTEFLADEFGDMLTDLFTVDLAEGDGSGATVEFFCDGSLKGEHKYGHDSGMEFAIKLLPLAASQDPHERARLLYLCPLLRLLSTCETTLNGDLFSIAKLNLCPLLLFDFEVMQSLDELSAEQRRVVCDTLFHAINWVRELLNCFSGEDEVEIRACIHKRLADLCDLERELEEVAEHLGSSVVFPVLDGVCMTLQPISGVAKSAKPAKKGSKGSGGGAKGKGKGKADKGEKLVLAGSNWQQRVCRELTLSALEILREDGIIEKEVDTESHTMAGSKEIVQMKPAHVLKLLTLMHQHLDQNTMTEASLASAAAALRFRMDHVVDLLSSGGDSEDAPDFDGDCKAKFCACLCEALSCCKAMLRYEDADIASLMAPFARASSSQDVGQLSLVDLCCRTFEYFDGCKCAVDEVDDMQAAVCWIELLQTIVAANDEAAREAAPAEQDESTDPIGMQLSRLAKDVLLRNWAGADESFKYKLAHIQFVVEVHLQFACEEKEDGCVPTEALRYMSSEVMVAVKELSGKEYASQCSTLSKQTFVAFLKPCLVRVVDLVSEVRDSGAGIAKQLASIATLVTIFKQLTLYTKTISNPAVLSPVMRGGQAFVEAIFACFELFEANLLSIHTQFIKMLKDLQGVTRQLQTICAHAKRSKNAALSNHAPNLKRSLEALLFRVRQLLLAHSVDSSFWIGTLKMKQLDGTEVREPEDEDDEDEDDEEDDDEDEGPEEE